LIIRYFADGVNWENGGRQLNVFFRKKCSPGQAEGDGQIGRLMKLWEIPNSHGKRLH